MEGECGHTSLLGLYIQAQGKQRVALPSTRGVCVCEGGEKVRIQAFHESLNGALSRVREKGKFLQERPSFYSTILAQYFILFIYLFFI